jgi:hypothetical protein
MSNKKAEENDKIDASAVYEMFEKIKELITKGVTRLAPASAESAPALAPEDSKRIETLADKLDRMDGKRDRPLKHHHTIDFMGNRALIALAVAVVAFLVSLWVIDHQRRTLAGFRDNDLKYRYIQMCGAATSKDILQLRNVFEFNRNPDSIKLIRRQVERYERLVKEQAENEARARLSDEQAKQLRQEAETVKGGKHTQ